MSRDARTIRQTGEAVTSIVTAFATWQRASEDGHVSFHEWVRMAGMVPEFWRAIEGASEIPKELNDLDGLEADELIEMVSTTVNSHIESEDMRLKIDKILIAFHAIADAVAQWRGVNPPRAQIVP